MAYVAVERHKVKLWFRAKFSFLGGLQCRPPHWFMHWPKDLIGLQFDYHQVIALWTDSRAWLAFHLIKFTIQWYERDKKFSHLVYAHVSFWARGGHSNGKRGYQARPWTHKKHPNHVLFRYEEDPKYAFLHAFFLICLSCSFQNLSIWPKTHPIFQFCTFLHP